MGDDGPRDTLLDGAAEAGNPPTAPLVEHSREDCQPNPCPPQQRPPIYKVPIEILDKIFDLVAPPRTRVGVYTLLKLTHVCQFWRIALINKPQAWATIFATQADCRSFVQTCLERSFPVCLEVTVDARKFAPPKWSFCTCNTNKRSRVMYERLRLIPNRNNPCEWHFVFELLVETRHSERIHELDIIFKDSCPLGEERVPLALKSCRFFDSSSFQLTSLKWTDRETRYANDLFSVPPFLPTLRFLSFKGYWNGQFTKVNNLTSFIFKNYYYEVDGESFRTFLLNNRSLETLFLKCVRLKDNSNGPPIDLPKVKSFSAYSPRESPLSAIFRVPALRHLSSLFISVEWKHGYAWFTFSATGDDIVFTIKTKTTRIKETWQDLTGHAQPSIKHVRLENSGDLPLGCSEGPVVNPSFTDTHTLEIGRGYTSRFYPDLPHDSKELGPQLDAILLNFPEDAELPDNEDDWDRNMLDVIEDLVGYRFEHGRSVSVAV
ncbi:hypothetical protein BJ322DRAFT_729080 [Thelephora terrestris]|uniref:F-box domain-containing protein n=1 Tax=Thelephora terrestris TaxID=56493 RepID=A0A9P6HIF0_9AGAM|nr:hypothetical protein BJ322DRAFT_729080 [Thelephora terrestris]